MCGRFTLTWQQREKLAEALGVNPEEINDADYRPRWNIAPTDPHWIVRMRYEERAILPAKWGLVNVVGQGRQARRQADQRSRRDAAFVQRLPRRLRKAALHRARGRLLRVGGRRRHQAADLVPSRGRRPALPRRPLRVLAAATPDHWQRTFTIVTTEPNALMAPVHNRMPVILPEEVVDQWLDPQEQDYEKLQKLLRPIGDDYLSARRVSQRANSVKNDDPSPDRAGRGDAAPALDACHNHSGAYATIRGNGPVAQRQSGRLITAWSQVRILPGPPPRTQPRLRH